MKIFKHIILALLSATLLVACQQDNADDNMPDNGRGTVTFRMKASPARQIKDATTDCELISSYRVIIATTGGRIIRCIDGECDPAAEFDAMKTELSIGTYHVYGFANISSEYLNSIGMTEGGNVPDNLASLRYYVPAPFSNSTLLPAESLNVGIPMSSARQTLTVTGPNQTFGVEVRRLFAKLEFVFSNPTDQDMLIRSQSISNMTVNGTSDAGSVLLMNYDEGAGKLNLPSPCPTAVLTHNYTTPLALNSGVSNVSKSFYVLESQGDDITNSFILDFDVRYADASAVPRDEGFRYALTDENTLTRICRNDWIRIPISLSEWHFRLEALWYPPIGGYPELEIKDKGNGEFVVTLLTPGEMTLFPILNRFDNPADKLYLTDPRIKNVEITLSGDDIFQSGKAPQLNDAKELTATVAQHGTACITLAITFTPNPAAPGVTKTMTRKIYIVY